MSTGDYLEQLGRAHGFTVDELRSNLQGVLHPAQSARLRRKGRIAATLRIEDAAVAPRGAERRMAA